MLNYQGFLPSGLLIIIILTSKDIQDLHFNIVSQYAMAITSQELRPTMDLTRNNTINKVLQILSNSRSTIGKKKEPELWKSSVDRIIDLFRKQKRKGGSRTSSCIALSKTVQDSLQTWSDRPLFVWEGAPKWVGIRSVGNESVDWSYEVGKNEQSVQYDGEVPLERGQEYTYWIQYSPLVGEEDFIGYQVSFNVMGEFDYQQLQRDLSQADLNTLNIDNEILAHLILERAYYFAQQGLFLDAVRELFLLSERSPGLEPQLEVLHCIFSPE